MDVHPPKNGINRYWFIAIYVIFLTHFPWKHLGSPCTKPSKVVEKEVPSQQTVGPLGLVAALIIVIWLHSPTKRLKATNNGQNHPGHLCRTKKRCLDLPLDTLVRRQVKYGRVFHSQVRWPHFDIYTNYQENIAWITHDLSKFHRFPEKYRAPTAAMTVHLSSLPLLESLAVMPAGHCAV